MPVAAWSAGRESRVARRCRRGRGRELPILACWLSLRRQTRGSDRPSPGTGRGEEGEVRSGGSREAVGRRSQGRKGREVEIDRHAIHSPALWSLHPRPPATRPSTVSTPSGVRVGKGGAGQGLWTVRGGGGLGSSAPRDLSFTAFPTACRPPSGQADNADTVSRLSMHRGSTCAERFFGRGGGGAEVVLVFYQRGQLVLSENCRRTRQPGKTLGNTSGDVLTSSLPPTSYTSMSPAAASLQLWRGCW